MTNIDAKTVRVVEFIESLLYPNERIIIALAGPPGSGKSTLAQAVVNTFNALKDPARSAALMPMDGFHLDNDVLVERGLLSRKGAPNTFDVLGLLELLQQVKQQTETLYYPLFDREKDKSLLAAGQLLENTSIVVVEGNYLLLDAPLWRDAKQYFDGLVFLNTPMPLLEERLLKRWLGLGFSLDDALAKAQLNDLPNAQLVLSQSVAADLILP